MIQYKTVSSPKIYTKRYGQFRGVDFSTGITEVEPYRSPDSVNIISDMSGFPEKRPGYKSILVSKFTDAINGIYPFVYSGTAYFIVHTGTKLYKFTLSESVSSTTLIYSGVQNTRSNGFVMNSKFYFMDGTNFLRYDGSNCVTVESVAYVPTTTIASPPAGGGTKYEGVNLLQPQRINRFLGTAGDTVYYLDTQNVASIDSILKLNVDGTWSAITSYTPDLTNGKVTFSVAPGVSPATGTDNIKIYFSKTISGNANKIKNCTIWSFYGIGSDTRVFLSGNLNYPNYDYKSGLVQPEYFVDTDYAAIGTETAIMGYLKQYDSQIIVKAQNTQDATMYVRTATTSSGTTTYPVQQGLVGVGAVSKYAFASLADDPVFLSKNGVYGVESNNVKYTRSTQLRSFYVNTRLMNESDLDKAHGCVWGRFYVLFVNSHCYVANSQQLNKNAAGGTGYEWTYWDNIPAVCSAEYNGDLYFGTSDGNICKFTTYEKYADDAYWDLGADYTCRWTTKLDDFGEFAKKKTILKKGVWLLTKPYISTEGKIYYGDEDTAYYYVGVFSKTTVSLDFTNDPETGYTSIDFSNGADGYTLFQFNTIDRPSVVPINHKRKDVSLFQVIVENSTGGTGFGLYGIEARYMFTKDVK